MAKEQQPTPSVSSLKDAFGFTEREARDYTVTHKRLLNLVNDPQSTVHTIELDYNNYGEFQFVTLSRTAGEKQHTITLYGLGFHEHRECWYTNQWRWYRTQALGKRLSRKLSKGYARKIIEDRRAEVQRYATDSSEPSSHAALFSLIADLTDEDGAMAELDDLSGLIDWLAGDEE